MIETANLEPLFRTVNADSLPLNSFQHPLQPVIRPCGGPVSLCAGVFLVNAGAHCFVHKLPAGESPPKCRDELPEDLDLLYEVLGPEIQLHPGR